MRRNMKSIAFWLLLGSLCLNACSPAAENKNPSERADAAEEPSGTVKEEADLNGENGKRETEGSKGSMDETASLPEGETREEAPFLLSLMTRTETDFVWDEDRLLCHTGYPRLWLDTRSDADSRAGALAFPELAEVLEEMNGRTQKTAEESIQKLESDARDMAWDEYFQEYLWEEELWVTRGDSEILSILKREYSYTGGAHGDYGYVGLTLDSRSGKQLELDEVVTDPRQFIELAADRLGEKYSDVEFFEPPKEVMVRELEAGSLTWTAGYDGLTLYFAPYELAPYAFGTQSVTILYKEQPELFTKQVCRVPGSWAVRLAPGADYDLGQDGVPDRVEAWAVSGEVEDVYSEINVCVNEEQSIVKDQWFYRYTPYLVHSDSLDTELLVMSTVSDNDYGVLMIYELDPDREGFRTPWQVSATHFLSYTEEKEDGTFEYGEEVFANPDHFALTTKIDLLSTYYGIKWYEFSEEAREDGYLKSEHPWYEVDRGDYYLTLLVPLEMETGDTGEVQTFPEGTKLWIVRTDGNYVEFRTEDNRTCRVYMESAEWPGWIKGVEDKDITEIFDGMMFAG